MDMSSTDNSTLSMMMTPYLHFTGGDSLFFRTIAPKSKGALAGAAVFLFFLAMLERFVVAMRAVMEAHWKQSARSALAARNVVLKDDTQKRRDEKAGKPFLASTSRTRMIPPFIVSHDVPRGVIHAAQSLIHFALMLAVMTFQAAYIITITLGLGVGELAFGRFATAASSVHGH
ncbi:hypothetical protein EW145_g5037 [Phellinidium pouzarii]|uniref:Copper transport protein n=1 Tax=Phellinidium pouzarii TaxID=167371 RepID=A0A4S4L1N2_9AGAM|nr:hypothetical protein EW145_g5037 [Phellinidium pouzarii]